MTQIIYHSPPEPEFAGGHRLFYSKAEEAAWNAKHGATPPASAKPAPKAKAKAVPARPAASAPIAKAAPPESIQARADAVIASAAFKGRERQGRELLLASCEPNATLRTSAAIIAALGKRCSDAELDRRTAAFHAAQADAMWQRAYGLAPERPKASVDAVWTKAYAAIDGRAAK